MGSSAATVQERDIRLADRPGWGVAPWICFVIGLAGLGAAWFLGSAQPRRFYFAYLTAYMFWLSVALGGMFFVLVQFAAKAGWSVVVRRLAENAMFPLWIFAPLFIPIYFGLHELYHWSHHEVVAADPILLAKSAYLNEPFFLLRAVLYFIVWTGVGLYFYRRSVAQDSSRDANLTRRLQRLSGPAILLFALSLTFASFDWMMSLDPHWYSTIFGVYYFAGSVVAIFAFLSLTGIVLQRAGVLQQVITTEHFHDLGKLLFAFTVFWTYIAFSQFMLYWYANIPEETIWFAHRTHGGWQLLTMILAVGHFALPFFYLMTRITKRRPGTLLFAAVWMLAMHYLDLYWLIMPENKSVHGLELNVVDLATVVGIGGLYLAFFSVALRRHALIPKGDPRLVESLSFENY